MKIVYVTGASVPSSTAHLSYVSNLCEALRRNGCDALIVGTRGPLDEAEFRRTHPQISLHVIGWSWLQRRSTLKLLLLAGMLLVRGRRWQANRLFIAHNDIVAAALALQGRKFVFDMHNFGPNSRILKYAMGSANCVGCIFSARTVKDAFEARFGRVDKSTLVLGSGIDPAYLKPRRERAAIRCAENIPEGRKVVAYIGSMGSDRGIDLMLETAARRKSGDLFWLFVGGRPDEVAAWRRRAADRGLADDVVRFAGFQPQNSLGDWYEISDIVCAPYRRKPEYLASMKMVEYLAIGKPILVADVPFAREILSPDITTFFDPDEPHALDHALDEALRAATQPRTASAHVADTWDAKAKSLIAWLQALPSGAQP